MQIVSRSCCTSDVLRIRVFLCVFLLFSSFGTLVFVAAAASIPSYLEVLADATACPQAAGLFVDANGALYCTCTPSDPAAASILRIEVNVESASPMVTMIANASDCPSAQAVIRHPNSGLIYLSCTDGVKALSITPAPSPMITLVNTTFCDSPEGLAVSPDGQYLAIACPGGIIQVELATSAVTTIFDVNQCQYAIGAVYFLWNSHEYIAGACGNNGIIMKDLSTGETQTIIDGTQCVSPSSIIHDSPSGAIYFSCELNGLFRLDQGSRNVTKLAPYAKAPFAQGVAHDAQSNITFAASVSADVIAITSEAIVQLVSHSVCGPSTSVVNVQGTNYVTCYSAGVLRVSGSTVTVTASYSDCQNPQSVLIDSDSGAVIGACGGGVISVLNNEITTLANETQCREAEAVYQDPVSREYSAACGTHGAITINASTHAVSTLITTTDEKCPFVQALYLDNKSGVRYVSCLGWGIAQLDPSNGNLTLLLSEDYCTSSASLSKIDSSDTIVVACVDEGILTISRDGTVTTLVNETTCHPNRVFIAGDVIFATCRISDNSVILIQGSTITPLVSAAICSAGFGIAQNPVTGTVYVACEGGSSVLSINNRTLAVTREVAASDCSATRMIAPDPLAQGIAIACEPSGLLFATTNYKCSPGTSWLGGSCVPCKAQYYRPYSNLKPMGVCQPCDSGFVAPVAGSASCSPCPMGSYDSKKTCLLCPLGKYQPASGTTSCIDCSPGSFAIYPGSTACTLCDAGFYAATNGSVSCSPCDRGSASSAIGLTHACDGCAPGSYQNGVGKTSCIDCEPHSYAEKGNSTSCTRCSSQVNADRTACTIVNCDPNSEFNEATNQCQLCPLSQYSSRGGLCTLCPATTYTPAIGSGCVSCDGIEGLQCFGGVASVAAGFWAYVSDSVNWTTTSADGVLSYPLYKTAPCQFCEGSLLQLDAAHVNATIEYCAYPRLNSANNTLCSQCEPGYLAWGDQCLVCNSVNGGLAFGYLVFSFALVIFLLTSSSSASSAASTSILLFFIQTASLEMGPIVKFLDWIQIIGNLDPKSAGTCLAPWSAYDQTLFALLIPLILIGELVVIGVIHYSLHQWLLMSPPASQQDSSSKPNAWYGTLIDRLRRFSVNDYRIGVISILLFCYTQVSTACLRYLHCQEIGPNSFNFSAPTIDCRSGEYKRYLVAVLIALIGYIIGFPVMAFITLWRHRESLYLPSDSDALRSSPSIASFMLHWAGFWKMYHPRAWFWQCWVLLRRAAFVVTSVLLMQESSKRFMTFNFLHFASLILHQYVRPYEDNKLNHIESVSYVLLMCISELLVGYIPPYPLSVQVWLFILIVPAGSVMILFIGGQRWKQWKQGQEESIRNNTDQDSLDQDPSNTPQSIEANIHPRHHRSESGHLASKQPSDMAIEMHPVVKPMSEDSHAPGDSMLPANSLDSEQLQL